jgi:spore maturation protein SpmA
MLNYIWGGLIVVSLVFALVNDANDIYQNNWQNGEPVAIEVIFPSNADLTRNQDIRFTIGGDSVLHVGRWYPVDKEAEIVVAVSAGLPDHWQTVAENQESSRKQQMRLYVHQYNKDEVRSQLERGGSASFRNGDRSSGDSGADGGSGSRSDVGLSGADGGSSSSSDVAQNGGSGSNGSGGGISGADGGLENSVVLAGGITMQVILPEVNFVKLRAITAAAFSMAEFGVTLALGLIGIMALWLGLMKIAEESGLILIVVKGVRPFMKWLFPEIPKDHPAMGMISLNLAANVLGLGNAATPIGIKAMEELQKLNPDKDTATNSMCMFLALNTSSVQLLPPVTLVAIMGLRVNELMVAITLTTIFSTMAGIAAAKWYARRNPPLAVAGVGGFDDDGGSGGFDGGSRLGSGSGSGGSNSGSDFSGSGGNSGGTGSGSRASLSSGSSRSGGRVGGSGSTSERLSGKGSDGARTPQDAGGSTLAQKFTHTSSKSSAVTSTKTSAQMKNNKSATKNERGDA